MPQKSLVTVWEDRGLNRIVPHSLSLTSRSPKMEKLAFKTWLESLGPDYVFGMQKSVSLNCPLAQWLSVTSGKQMYVGLTCGWEVGEDRPMYLAPWAQEFRSQFDYATTTTGTVADALRVLESLSTPEIVS